MEYLFIYLKYSCTANMSKIYHFKLSKTCCITPSKTLIYAKTFQNIDTSGISTLIRQRPQPSSKENTSPPPPLPPKKIADIAIARPPPRPPHDHELDHDEGSDTGPPLPRPARKKEPLVSQKLSLNIDFIST